MFDRTNRTLICSVVFLDIVEYSRQPVSEQMLLKERFNALLHDAMQDIAVNDRIMLDTGDGAAISFLGDPEDVLFVVMNLRDTCKEMATSGQPLGLRIGINLGPVKLVKDINGRPNLIGDGINVAQRIMSFAAPGEVMVSRSFYEVVSCLSDEYASLFNYEGARTDKHVREHEVYAVGYSEQVRQEQQGRRRGFRGLTTARPGTPRHQTVLVKQAALGGGAIALLGVAWLGFTHVGISRPAAGSSAISAFKPIETVKQVSTLAAGQNLPQPPSGIPISNTPHLATPAASPAMAMPATLNTAASIKAATAHTDAAKPGSPTAPSSTVPEPVKAEATHATPLKPVPSAQGKAGPSSPGTPKPAKPEAAHAPPAKPGPTTQGKTVGRTGQMTEPDTKLEPAKPRECPALECWPDGRPKHDR